MTTCTKHDCRPEHPPDPSAIEQQKDAAGANTLRCKERKQLLATQDSKIIITLGRQYGSGGRIIGKILAEELGIPFYDKELIAMGATRSGLNSQLLSIVDEQSMHIYMQASSAAAAASRGDTGDAGCRMSLNDQLFMAQSEVIRQAAEKGSCVIVGRTANHILRNQPFLLTFFVHAPKEARIRTIMRLNNVSREDAERMVTSSDRHRAQYYRRHTGRPWADMANYDLAVDSTILGVEGTALHLAEFARAAIAHRNDQ